MEASHRVDDQSEDAAAAAHQLAKPLEGLALYLERPFVELHFAADSEPEPEPEAETEEDKQKSQKGAGKRLIALHPGSGSPRKNWSQQAWVEVARKLRKRYPEVEFLIVVGEAETEAIDDFLLALDGAEIPYLVARELPLPKLGTRYQSCDLFLGHDSGMSHLAAACGLPCVLLFGPTSPTVWAPQNPAVKVIVADGGDLHTIEVSTVVDVASESLEP